LTSSGSAREQILYLLYELRLVMQRASPSLLPTDRAEFKERIKRLVAVMDDGRRPY
jgi:hypothetical protein